MGNGALVAVGVDGSAPVPDDLDPYDAMHRLERIEAKLDDLLSKVAMLEGLVAEFSEAMATGGIAKLLMGGMSRGTRS